MHDDQVPRLLSHLEARAKEEEVDFVLAGPAPKSAIEEAERALGVVFPRSYRSFLETYGAGCCTDTDDYAFLGISREACFGVVNATLRARKKQGLADRFVIVVDAGSDGVWYCLDTATTTEEGECPIVEIEERGALLIDRVFPTFTEMLVHGLRVNAGLPPEED
jgi:hypothetical protein